jgi:hypothetical protein
MTGFSRYLPADFGYTSVDQAYGSLTRTLPEEPVDAAEDVGYQQVYNPNVIVESFLRDRPPPVKEEPEEAAEIRWGEASDFEYDLSNATGTPDFFVQDQETNGEIFKGISYNYTPDDPTDDEEPPEPDEPQGTAVLYDIQEVARVTEVVRVSSTDGDMYVDIERIVNVIFEMPAKYGPDGSIKEFYRFNMNWGQQS